MFNRKNLAERVDRLEDMVIERDWEIRNLTKRVEALESARTLKELKEYNAKDAPKRKVGRPRKTERADFAKKK